MVAPALVGTDGACQGNPGPMGWAWVAPDGTTHGAGAPRGTNQQAELRAILLALKDFPTGELTIQSDSAYAIGCSSTWKAGWQRSGYRRPSGPISNLDVIQPIHQLLDTRGAPVDFVKVKGHDPGNRWPLNTGADEVSVRMADEASRSGSEVDFRGEIRLVQGDPSGPSRKDLARPMLSLSAVKARPGWTDSVVATFLGDPDELRPNPKYKSAAPMRMYLLQRVESVEASTEWAARTRSRSSR